MAKTVLERFRNFVLRTLPEKVKQEALKQQEQKQEPVPKPVPKPAPKPKPTPEPVKEKVYGTRGRIEIPDLNIGVPIYGTESGGAQQVIDRQDSAVYLRWPGQITIADHCDQANFSNLKYATPGHTKAYIVTRESKTSYVCYKTQVGHIRIGSGSNTLYDSNWEPAFTKNQGGLTMYTCIEKSAPDVMDVRLVYWKPI